MSERFGENEKNLSDPLLPHGSDDDSTAADSGRNNAGYREDAAEQSDIPLEKMTPSAMAKSAAVVLVAGGGIATYLASFVFVSTLPTVSATATTVLGVAGGVCILAAPLVLANEWRLSKLPALQGRVTSLRHKAEQVQMRIDVLVAEERNLREEVKAFGKTYERLKQLGKKNAAGNVDAVLDLVHQNQVTVHQMKDSVRQMALQDIVKLVLQCEIDQDKTLSTRETQMLETRLSAGLEIYGITFDAEKFYRVVGLNPSLYDVMAIVKRLLPGEINRHASVHDMSSDGEDSEAKEEDDIYDMFYYSVEDQFNKGCVDSIRWANDYVERKGERPTLMSVSPSTRITSFRKSVMKRDMEI